MCTSCQSKTLNKGAQRPKVVAQRPNTSTPQNTKVNWGLGKPQIVRKKF